MPINPHCVPFLTLATPSGTRFTAGRQSGELSVALTYRASGAPACDQDGRLNLAAVEVLVFVATPSGLGRVPFNVYLQGSFMPLSPQGVCG